MSRLKVFALAAALALGSLTVTTEASAGWHHGWHHHWGGGWGYWHHWGWGWRGAYWGGPYYYGGYYPYAGCWRWRRVWTPFGWQLRRINVCY